MLSIKNVKILYAIEVLVFFLVWNSMTLEGRGVIKKKYYILILSIFIYNKIFNVVSFLTFKE